MASCCCLRQRSWVIQAYGNKWACVFGGLADTWQNTCIEVLDSCCAVCNSCLRGQVRLYGITSNITVHLNLNFFFFSFGIA